MSAYAAGPIAVYILDDLDLVRRGLRDLLAAARDVRVVRESGSALDAADMILAAGTDVMLLDLHVAGGTGVRVCRRVRAVNPSVRGLPLTAAGDDEATIATRDMRNAEPWDGMWIDSDMTPRSCQDARK